MTNDKEYFGTLRGFDDYLNLVLDDVKEYSYHGHTTSSQTSTS